MSIYFTVRVFTENPRGRFSVLVENAGNTIQPWGTDNERCAHRFLWKDDSVNAMRKFMSYAGDSNMYSLFVRGEVFCVVEKSTNIYELQNGQGAHIQHDTEANSIVVSTLDLDEGERLLAASKVDLGEDHDPDGYQEAALWLYENADELLDSAREREYLVQIISDTQSSIRGQVGDLKSGLEQIQISVERLKLGNDNDLIGS